MKNIALALFLLCSFFGKAQDFYLHDSFWNNYTGTLGDRAVFMTIYPSEDGKLVGNYFYTDEERPTKIQFTGQHTDGTFSLIELSDSSETNILKGKFYTDREGFDKVSGTWKGEDQSQIKHLDLLQNSAGWGLPDKRYVGYHGTDEDVENYAYKIKSAILNKEKEWLADQFVFPMEAHVKGKKVKVKNKKFFIDKYFDIIFHDEFSSILKDLNTLNLHQSNDALMMGRGQIWILRTDLLDESEKNGRHYYINWLAT